MSMAMMVAMASRKRDDKGRYMDDNDGRRMGNDHSTHMGGYDREMNDQPEMRRRRDSNGRYMDGGEGNRMVHDGGHEMAYRPWPEPTMPPYLARPGMNDRTARDFEHPSHQYMRDRNIVNIRDYQDRRQNIGFRQADDEEGPEMRQYGRRYDPDRMSAYEAPQKRQEMGHAEGYEDGEHLTREQAEKWVRGMKSEDGRTGGRWPYEEIKRYAANFGIQGEEKIVEFFAVMNALYSDYCKVAKKYGVDKTDFWADLAKAFIHDKDAKSGKVKMYYECIAEHDED